MNKPVQAEIQNCRVHAKNFEFGETRRLLLPLSSSTCYHLSQLSSKVLDQHPHSFNPPKGESHKQGSRLSFNSLSSSYSLPLPLLYSTSLYYYQNRETDSLNYRLSSPTPISTAVRPSLPPSNHPIQTPLYSQSTRNSTANHSDILKHTLSPFELPERAL